MAEKHVVIAGGGTGGHLFPGVAVVEALQELLGDGVRFSFVGSEAFGREIGKRGVEVSEYEKIIVTQVVPSPLGDEHAVVREYREAIRRHFPDESPNYVSLEGYLNAKLLSEALRRTGPEPTREGLITAFEGMEAFDLGIGRRVSFGPLDHQGMDDIYYSRLSPDGNFRDFTP